jgi:hypothetical protein
MHKTRLFVALIACLHFGGTMSLLQGQAPSPSVEQQLRSQYRVPRVDENGVVHAGTVVIVRQAGIRVLPAPAEWPCNTYKQGDRVKESTKCVFSTTKTTTNALRLGGSVQITALQVKPSEVVLHVQTLDGAFRGAISFQFPKGYLDSVNAKEVEDTIRDIFVPAPAKRSLEPAVLEKLVGQYVRPQATNDRLQLNADGTFSVAQAGQNLSGTFTITGDNLMLRMGGRVATCALHGNSIIDDEGLTWVKQGPATPPGRTQPLRLPSTYISIQTPADQLQLNADNSLSLQEAGQTYRGTFAVIGQALELNMSESNIKTTLTIQGNSLIDSSGQAWTMKEQAAAGATGEGALQNQDVIKLVKAGLDDVLIIAKISSSKCQFDMSTDALIQLKTGGVSAAVLKAMMGAGK